MNPGALILQKVQQAIRRLSPEKSFVERRSRQLNVRCRAMKRGFARHLISVWISGANIVIKPSPDVRSRVKCDIIRVTISNPNIDYAEETARIIDHILTTWLDETSDDKDCQKCKGRGYHEAKLRDPSGKRGEEWHTVPCDAPACRNGVVTRASRQEYYESIMSWGVRSCKTCDKC